MHMHMYTACMRPTQVRMKDLRTSAEGAQKEVDLPVAGLIEAISGLGITPVSGAE